MAVYTTCAKFENYAELGDELSIKLKIFGIEKVSINDKEITLVGKGHPQLWAMVQLDSGETVDDFEGIDDESKKIGHTFPLEKAYKIISEAFGYAGKFVPIGEEVLYLREDGLNDEVQEQIGEALEAASALLDVNDEKETILETTFDILIQIASIIGNQNLEDELNACKINNM